jgi:hypothetical protein
MSGEIYHTSLGLLDKYMALRDLSELLPLIPEDHQKTRKKEYHEDDHKYTRSDKNIQFDTEEIKRRGGVPIIPPDPCCAKLCKILNDKIDIERKSLNISVSVGGGKGLLKSRTYRTLKSMIEALEDHRFNLKDTGTCKCVEEQIDSVGVILPFIEISKEEESKKIKEHIPFSGPKLQGRPPEKIREIYRGTKSILPETNSCCPASCKILNKDIDESNKILDNMELRGGPYVYDNRRYENLSYRTFALQRYRANLKEGNSCKCSSNNVHKK